MSTTYSTTPWSDSVVKDYLTATSQQKSDPEKFYRTHLDIDQIYAEFLGAIQNTFVSQEELRDEILSGDIDDDIRTYILKGETGSGKSQLCQWLDYELQGIGEADDVDERIPLHIKASETSLEQIVSTLAGPLGIDPGVSQVTELDPRKIAHAIVTSISASPGQKLKDADIDRIIDEGGLESIIEENIERYQRGLEEEDETEFDPNLISREDYRTIRLTLGTDSLFHKNQKVLRQALRDEIHRHFSHLIGVEDFQGQLREYAEAYIDEQGARPVIICEDVTTFSVLKEQLLDQIIQVESSSFDIVLGYTTGFEQDDLEDALGGRGSQDALTYLKDRAEGYLSLTEDGTAYFLNDSLAVDLVRKYLDVIKEESGADLDEELETAFDDLYPFNRAAIQVAYDRLQEDGSPRRTPRVLLQKVVRRCLLSDKPPYQVLEESTNIKSPVPAIDITKYEKELQQLATWYGYQKPDEEESNTILVHSGVLKAFGFAEDVGERLFEDSTETYVEFRANSKMTTILGGTGSRPVLNEPETTGTRPERGTEVGSGGGDDTENGAGSSSGGESRGSGGDSSGTGSGTGDRSGRSGGSGSNNGGGDDPTEDRFKEFSDWIETGGEYESSGVLRSGAEDVLEMWYDPTRLANANASTTGSNGIYYTHGTNVPVSIQGPDERDGLSVMVEFGTDDLDLKLDLLKVGLEDELPSDINGERLRSWATDSVTGLRGDIRENVDECLPDGFTIEHSIVLAKFMLTNAEFGRTNLDRSLLFDRSNPSDHRDYEEPIASTFGPNHSLYSNLAALKTRRSDIEGLVDGFFLLKKNLVDHERLKEVQREIADDPDEYVQLAQQINTEKLDYPKWYKIGSNRGNASTKVTTFLDAISDYAVELHLLTDADVKERFETTLEAVNRWHDASHTIQSLTESFETLRSALGTFGVTEKQSWTEAHEKLTADENLVHLGEFTDGLSKFRDVDTQTPFERIELLHEFQRSREKHGAWEVYKALDQMIDELASYDVDDSDNLKDRLMELDASKRYEENRNAVIRATEDY